jgi:hypothetical protein
MRIARSAAAIGAAGGVAFSLGVATPVLAQSVAAAAPASRPLPKIQTGPDGWYHGWKVRPGYVYFGGGASFSAPRIKQVHWTAYTQHGAWANGRWLLDTCKPDCALGGYWVNARAHFYHVFNHAGPGRNFGQVTVTWRGGKWSAYINSRGQWVW